MCVTAQIVPGTFANPLAGKNWNGWGDNTSNTRFQDANDAGITAAQAPRLKVKWAFGFPGDLDANAQPTVVGGRVFVGSQGGKVYSLSADSGCVHWFFKAAGSVRGAVTIGAGPTSRLAPARHSVYAAFFGDLGGNVYALNATTGAQLWTIRADAHPLARVVGSVVFHNGRLYVPVASAEETAGAPATYECCRFRGSVSARRGDRQANLEDVHDRRRSEADEEERHRHAAVGTVGRGRLEQPGHRSGAKHPLRDDGRQLQRAGVEHERFVRRDGPRHREDPVVAADDGRRRVEHGVPAAGQDELPG